MSENKTLILSSLSVLCLVLFNVPMLSLFNPTESNHVGSPKLYIYLFIIWLTIIGSIFWIVRKSEGKSKENE
ncbi:MAG: hypothetical protein ACK4GN_17770 [Runella sp.]